jgi:hypothetical protein
MTRQPVYDTFMTGLWPINLFITYLWHVNDTFFTKLVKRVDTLTRRIDTPTRIAKPMISSLDLPLEVVFFLSMNEEVIV